MKDNDAPQKWVIPAALYVRMTEIARLLRKTATPSEAILWRAIRHRQLGGRKFRRQEAIGPFVADFFCPEERLVVEVDGDIHLELVEADRIRQELLESLGLRVIRIEAKLVEEDVAAALEAIREALKTPHPPAPSPTGGEGET